MADQENVTDSEGNKGKALTDTKEFISLSDQTEKRTATVYKGEIKRGLLHYLVCDISAIKDMEKTELSRDPRLFSLMNDRLKYFRHGSEKEVEKSYSLSRIEKILYEDHTNSRSFHLHLSTTAIVLQAETQEDALDWVGELRAALKQDETRAGRSDEENARGVQDDLDQKEPAALCSATVILENEEEAKAEEKIEMKETVDGNSKVVEEKVPSKNEDEQPLVCDNNSKTKDSAFGVEEEPAKFQWGGRLPFITELTRSREKRSSSPAVQNTSTMFANPLVTAEFPSTSPSAEVEAVDDTNRKHHDGAIKTGQLFKTTVGRKEGSKQGPTRHRHFRLTDIALEYLHLFSHVKVKRSFPITSIEEVHYDEANEPTVFHLIFSNCIEILEAETAKEASDWVEKIVNLCEKWHASPREESFDESEPEVEREADGESTTQNVSDDDQSSHKRVESDSEGGPSKCRFSAAKMRQRSFTSPPSVVTEENNYHLEKARTAFTGWRNTLLKRKSVRNKERLMSSLDTLSSVQDLSSEENVDFQKECLMIMYPRHMLGLPNEKLIKFDASTMQIMWKRTHRSKFHRSRSLSLHKVLEIREGQNTEMFDKFPFEQVERQSFSLIFQQEDKRYTHLASLDLVCDQLDNYNLWINELKMKIASQNCCRTHPKLSSRENDSTDTTKLWLKQLWSCKSIEGELLGKDAVSLAKKLNPFISQQEAKRVVIDAHEHQVEPSHGLSLDFDGFVLLHHLLHDTPSRLLSIYKEYAKTSPLLGMSLIEFRKFLVDECNWQRESCSNTALRSLMKSHDTHHGAYKKYSANNKPSDFAASRKRLSLAGFLSFLRSNDNPAVDPEHETVYQDMTQPLSHYFINSSHNTYLEGHQLNGKSSTEAYTRVLLQGCRCIEIDCWDDTLNVTKLPEKEPIIYHGFTLTTKLPFRDVIHTIKDYAFQSTPYPVVISIENHCNKAHQAKMALMFRAIFGDLLPQEDLVEKEERSRLPSPEELKRKIILKSPVTENKEAKEKAKTVKKMTKAQNSSTTVIKTPSRTNSSSEVVEQNTAAESTHESEALIDPRFPTKKKLSSSSSKVDSEGTDDAHRKFNQGPLRLSFHRRQLRQIKQKVEELEHDKDDQEVEFIETVEDLSSLIIYAKCKYIKPWSWEEQRKTKVTQLLSFGEPTAIKLCIESSRDMLAATERQLVRTYPKGIRFDSSNYDPLIMWNCGIQMATLNFQTPDISMHINQGFFRRNGGCGYVLKPAIMRKEDPGGGLTPFDPEMQTPHPDVAAVDLEIELISGQRLCAWKKRCSSVAVTIHTYGISHDCTSIKLAAHNNALSPDWKEGKHHLKRTLYMPELCLVYFSVETDRKLFGQNCISVVSLQPGIKFIPLRTPGGELIPGSGLFVKIKKAFAAEHVVDISVGAEPEKTLSSLSNRIIRQDMIDIKEEEARSDESKTFEMQENKKSTSHREESMDLCRQRESYRRFTSPASLTCDSNPLTVVAEVYENTEL